MMISRWTRMVATVLLSGLLLLLSAGRVVALQVGDKAADFSRPATTAEAVSLTDYLGKKAVVLYFFTAVFGGT
jgi:AhpC/TSA family